MERIHLEGKVVVVLEAVIANTIVHGIPAVVALVVIIVIAKALRAPPGKVNIA